MIEDRGVVDISHLYNYKLITIRLRSFQTLQWLFEGEVQCCCCVDLMA